ncbi:MAG: DUF2786 domain-containing protein [Rhodothermales bacterium]
MAIDQKIIERISKLLALAAGTSSVHEAESAERQAMELMRKYMISATDLQANRYVIQQHDTRWHRIPGWASLLMHTICSFVGVYDLYITGRSEADVRARWVLSGLPADIENALYLFDALVAQLERHTKAFIASYNRPPARWAVNDFRNGWTEAVHTRLRHIAQRVFPNKVIEGALVPADKRSQIEVWYKKTTGQRPRLSSVVHRKSEGYYDGMRKGTEVQVNQGISRKAVPEERRLRS